MADCFSGQTFSQTADQEAIKKVCLDETQAYMDLDYDLWISYHVQSADEQLVWNNPGGSFGLQASWDTIRSGMKDWFKTAKKENRKLTSNNFAFVIQGDMAFASYSTSSRDAAGKTRQKRDCKTLLNIK